MEANISKWIHYYRSRNWRIAIMVTGIVTWCILGGIMIYTLPKPIISTSYYHANIQFRAGTPESYEDIFLQSLTHIVDMYDRHPTWKWTLECQGLLIEMAYEDYPDIFAKIQAQNQRGQLELITPQYSHGLAVAYNYKDFTDSIKYNKYLLEEVYNLSISPVIVLQEGQYLPAFPLLKELGFTTVAISRDQLAYHNYFPNKPLMQYSYAGIPGYVMPLSWLPCYEAGVLHHQLALSDSERINTGDIEGPHEFNYNPGKMAQIELRHMELEKIGNIFMTMAEWVDYCIEHNQVGIMSKFLPESHWTPNRHQSVSRWMAWGNGYSDDGVVHARNYYTRNLIQTAEIILEKANQMGIINSTENQTYHNHLLEANKLLWLAQVTDTSGVTPNEKEFEYAVNNTYEAQQKANYVIDQIRTKHLPWQGTLEIQAWSRQILTDASLFSNYTNWMQIQTITFIESKYNLQKVIEYTAEIRYPHQREIINTTWNCFINQSFYSFPIEILRYSFTGPRGVLFNNTQTEVGKYNQSAMNNGAKVDQHIKFFGNWEQIAYTPSLADNKTQNLTRSDYTPPGTKGNDDYICPLPISNGLIYNFAEGYAIITNNTVRHISVKWEGDYLDFYETEVKYNSQYEFILYKGTLESAHLLASLINPYPNWQLEAI